VTLYCVRYRRGGTEHVRKFDAAMTRALFLITMSAHDIAVLAEWEEASDAR
jgi:hypothetical protein